MLSIFHCFIINFHWISPHVHIWTTPIFVCATKIYISIKNHESHQFRWIFVCSVFQQMSHPQWQGCHWTCHIVNCEFEGNFINLTDARSGISFSIGKSCSTRSWRFSKSEFCQVYKLSSPLGNSKCAAPSDPWSFQTWRCVGSSREIQFESAQPWLHSFW